MVGCTKIINGVPVKFPYEKPYDIQLKYMEKVIESLENKQNAILESPTGTGKTLTLLCATLGWISKQNDLKTKWLSKIKGNNNDDDSEEEATESDKENSNKKLDNVSNMFDMIEDVKPMEKTPQVIYASRTHSQLTQAMKELKNSPYKDTKVGVYASRGQLCIHPDIKGQSNTKILHKCQKLTKDNGCAFKNRVHQSLKEPDFEQPIIDIEDLGILGNRFNCCPYYASMELRKKAEIIFLPYGYLLDPKIRDFSKIDLKDAIVILDEAHNVEKECEQNACTSISTKDLDDAIGEINHALELYDEDEDSDDETSGNQNYQKREFAAKLQLRLQTLESFISFKSATSNQRLRKGGYLFSSLGKEGIDITRDTFQGDVKLMNDLVDDLCHQDGLGRDAKGLKKVSEFLTVAFSISAGESDSKIDQCCGVQFKNPDTLNFWCFSPAMGMKHLFEKEIRCLIMTSGTLEPLDELAKEMEIPSPIKFKNQHIIDQSQVFANIVTNGKDGVLFDSSFRNRFNENYLKSIGKSLIELCDCIPGGILVFFASYNVMGLCRDEWERSGIWPKMKAKRPIYVEEQGQPSKKFNETMHNYYNSINTGNGAIFMAVLRGKVSEGVDFTDMYGRATVIVGIPFASIGDMKTKRKMEYMDAKQTLDRETLSGSEWYCLDAIRAVNQAIGRVIRHRHDYGAILLFDYRFGHSDKKGYISTWVKQNLDARRFVDFKTLTQELKVFFERCERTLPEPQPKRLTIQVELDLSDDDDDTVYNTTTVGEASYDLIDLEEEDSDDRDFLDDGSVDSQYSCSRYSENLSDASDSNPPSSPLEGTSSRLDQNQRVTRSRASQKRKRQSTNSRSMRSPQPSTSYQRCDSSDNEKSESSSGSDDKINEIMKQTNNGKKFKRIIASFALSDSEDAEGESANGNPILTCFEQNLIPNQFNRLADALSEYKKDNGSYERYRDTLFEIFNGIDDTPNLMGMMLFLKAEHQAQFDEDIRQKTY